MARSELDQNIYVDLDSILDTRLGTVHCISPDLACTLQESGYASRVIDDWDKLLGADNAAIFRERYSKRGTEELQSSVMTGMVPHLRAVFASMEKSAVNGPLTGSFTLTVNAWPYKMHPTEEDEIRLCLFTLICPFAEILFVNIPHNNLTPAHIKENYDAVIMYDFDTWLTYHWGALDLCKMPRVSFYAPALFLKEPTMEELEKAGVNPANGGAFKVVEASLAGHMALTYQDSSYFSMIVNP